MPFPRPNHATILDENNYFTSACDVKTICISELKRGVARKKLYDRISVN